MASESLWSQHTILKVLVGSQAHGLAESGSDVDYRGVYVIPTANMFHLNFKYQPTRWTKEGGDETNWEVGQFLSLGIQCHPLILESLLAPVVEADEWGRRLRALFPALWNPQGAYEAFMGYCDNQRKKFLEKKDERPTKYALAYIRVLYNLCELLETGQFTVQISETPLGATLGGIKQGTFTLGQIIDMGEEAAQKSSKLLPRCRHRPDYDAIDAFLVRLRKAFLS